MTADELKKVSDLIRKWCLISTTESASGHPTTCMSASDLATVLFGNYLRYNLDDPLDPNNDRFVLSKGHAAPLLYSLFAVSGAMPLEELKTLRKIDSRLEGHPTPEFKYADAATGSLGQGLSIAAGLAYLAKNENLPYRAYCLLGDGELAEGQVWEAANFASHYNLDNLIAIADINRLGQSQETMLGHHIEEYMNRFRSFGFSVIAIDGHNLDEIDKAFQEAVNNQTGKPYVIVAKTLKGKGVSFLENKDGWHGKALKRDELDKAIDELGNPDDSLKIILQKPHSSARKVGSVSDAVIRTKYSKGESIATRDIYGKVLSEIADENPQIYSLDAEVKNSTFSIDFLKEKPNRFIECFIAEQNMVGVAVGLSRLQRKPFVSTFAAFLTRAFDQIRMARVSGADIAFVGSHAGVSIGEDGASQMGLEDFSTFGTLPDSIIFHPSDAVSMAKVMPIVASHKGISYLRTLRPKTKVVYDNDEEFAKGGSKILRQSDSDVLTVVACGITVQEALMAAETLEKDGVNVRVVDCYSVKPVDKEGLKKCLEETKRRLVITVEDHFEHGGLGDFVLSALSDTGARIEKMAVKQISHSGKMEELLDHAGISSKHIVEKVRGLV